MKLNTFSITARCERTGQLGVAVSTAVVGVGSLCPFVQSGVGAVATQSFVNPYLGIWGLEYLAQGHSAQETLELLKTRDPGLPMRQFAVVDTKGGSAAFSGKGCDGWYGHLTGPNYAVAGNMLVGSATLEAMQQSFVSTADLSLAERLLRALDAGQKAGGDKRGKQSAALKVYSTEQYPLLELRVDEHPDPVTELLRVYGVAEQNLIPLLGMLPTLANPAGAFDLEDARRRGLLQD
ncbi:MAG: DUF1028 domain-containing protein [Meiothermus sp.]|nr:DUF1028 domain-containing protein [Meiothermus sp.]